MSKLPRNQRVRVTRQRALIDWDHEALGIWRIGSGSGAIGWGGWSERLTPELLVALKAWNDREAEMTRRNGEAR